MVGLSYIQMKLFFVLCQAGQFLGPLCEFTPALWVEFKGRLDDPADLRPIQISGAIVPEQVLRDRLHHARKHRNRQQLAFL